MIIPIQPHTNMNPASELHQRTANINQQSTASTCNKQFQTVKTINNQNRNSTVKTINSQPRQNKQHASNKFTPNQQQPKTNDNICMLRTYVDIYAVIRKTNNQICTRNDSICILRYICRHIFGHKHNE